MILSIGMIVKNEEKYLEQCLNGIKPILDNVDSELIIADTGSTDRTVEIAKKFTDNVYHFEWINDFAAARNSTLERAKGEWYMFIDADEVFQSCDSLIRFFNSGEYKKYGSGIIQLHSFSNENLIGYTLNYMHRLTKKTNDLYFEGTIHERFNQMIVPSKKFSDIVFHYGYVFIDKEGNYNELSEKKTERNLNLLFEEIKDKSPEVVATENYAAYKQIADCYIVLGKLDEAIDYLKIGLEHVDRNTYGVLVYYGMLAFIYRKKGATEELNELCYRYLNEPFRQEPLLCDVNMYAYLIVSNARLGKNDEAVKFVSPFFDIYKKFRRESFNPPDIIFTQTRIDDDYFDAACLLSLQLCWKNEKYNTGLSVLGASNIPRICSNSRTYDMFAKEFVHYIEHFGYAKVKKYIDEIRDITRIFYHSLKINSDISPFLENMDKNAASLLIDDMFKSFQNDVYTAFEEYDINRISDSTVPTAAFIYGRLLFESTDKGRNIENIFRKYGEISQRCAALPDCPDFEDIKAGIIINSICESRANRDYRNCIALMRQLIAEHRKFAKIVSVYKDYLQEEVNG